jgi:membrane protease YdiL (CAAX protease family)
MGIGEGQGMSESIGAVIGKLSGLGANAQPIRWTVLLTLPGAFAALLAAIVIGSAADGFYLGLGGMPPAHVRAVVETYLSGTRFQQIFGAAGYVFVLAVCLIAFWRLRRAEMVGRFARVPPRNILWAALSGIMLALAVMVLLASLQSTSTVTFHSTSGERIMMAHKADELPLSLFTIAVLAPLAEELYFRGLLFSWLAQKIWLPLAGAISAIVFALFHLHLVLHPGAEGWILTGVITALGLLNAFWVARTGSLWTAIATHASYNSVLVLLDFVGRVATNHAVHAG